MQFRPQPRGAVPGCAAFLRSGELPGGGGRRHRPQQGVGVTECGSCDTDPPAPCPGAHQDAHHKGGGPPGPPRIPHHGWDPPGDWCGGMHTDSDPQSCLRPASAILS